MTEPTSVEEIIASRNRLLDQRQKSTDTISTSLRTIGIGLAAITYSFVFTANPISNLLAQKNLLFIASTCGVISLFFDILQSFAERKSAQATLDFLKGLRDREPLPTAKEIEEKKKRSGSDVAFAILVVRALVCLVGFAVLLVAIGKSVL